MLLKRLKTLAFLVLCLQLFHSGLNAQTTPLKMMSYNIRCDAKVDEDNGWGWSRRKQPVCDLIRLMEPDLLGLQEVQYHQLQFIESQFPDYAWVGKGRDDGDKAGEFSPIFYNKDKFKLIGSGTFWLSETPEKIGSKGWDAALPRVCTWVKLKHKSSGKIIVHFNTHFDHIGKIAREESAKLIMKKVMETAGENKFAISGDFNSPPEELAYKTFSSFKFPQSNKHVEIKDACLSAQNIKFGPAYTFTGFDTNYTAETIQKIDFFFVPSDVKVLNYYTLPISIDKKYVSDHCPIVSYLLF